MKFSQLIVLFKSPSNVRLNELGYVFEMPKWPKACMNKILETLERLERYPSNNATYCVLVTGLGVEFERKPVRYHFDESRPTLYP